jgi:hypothetical protein
MNTYRYAILPLFALGLAFSSPVLAGEGDSPNVPPEDAAGDSAVYDNDAVGVDETDDEMAKLPFETDPDENGSDAGDTAGDGDAAAADDAGDAGDAADAGGADDGTDGADTGDTSAAAADSDSDSEGET